MKSILITLGALIFLAIYIYNFLAITRDYPECRMAQDPITCVGVMNEILMSDNKKTQKYDVQPLYCNEYIPRKRKIKY